MDLRQTNEYGKHLKSLGWVVDECMTKNGKKSVSVFIRKIPMLPFGVAKIQRFTEELDTKSLDKVKRKNRVVYTIVEPGLGKGDFFNWRRLGYRINKSPYLPTKTLIIDLALSKKQLWRGLKKDARQTIGKNDDLLIREIGNNLEEFGNEWKKTKRGYFPGNSNFKSLLRCFGKKGWVMAVEDTNVSQLTQKLLAGTVILCSGDTAYYYYAWTNKKGRDLGVQYRLVWEAMMKAKEMGYKYFDFEGIEDERIPHKSWKGFSMFKKKFGGKEVEYPGSFVKWL